MSSPQKMDMEAVKAAIIADDPAAWEISDELWADIQSADRQKFQMIAKAIVAEAQTNAFQRLVDQIKEAQKFKPRGLVAVGDRVIAVRDDDATTIYSYGPGVYEGEKPCPYAGGAPNPHIILDGGGEVWGLECHWGPEHVMQDKINATGKTVTVIPAPVRGAAAKSPLATALTAMLPKATP